MRSIVAVTMARGETVTPYQKGTYHCWSRCVRRAFLCGYDKLTGKNYEHRKTWVEARMVELVKIFAIDVLAYAVMDNHKHVALRNYPEEVKKWTSKEVANRWLMLFPRRRDEEGRPEEPDKTEIVTITEQPELVEKLRWRLCDISWFMRCLKEDIAKRANKEDDVTGCFWEGRFKCTRLDDEAATLSCMVYIDLNPIRAGKSKSIEESEFTSAFSRIRTKQLAAQKVKKQKKGEKKVQSKDITVLNENWLCPIEKIFKTSRKTKVRFEDYLVLLDRTGRELAKGKRGQISREVKPILERMSINAENWMNTSSEFGRMFPRVAGSVGKMQRAAEVAKRKWFKGLSAAAVCF